MSVPFLAMQEILKIFPPAVVALDRVSVEFRPGEIHAVVGENGAGKSTLMKVLYGLEAANSGQIQLRGQAVQFHSPGQAIAAGIGMVHQEILLVQEYRVWENIVLGLEPAGWFGRLDERQALRSVQQKIDEFHFNLDPLARVGEISVAARQKVEILKLLYRNVAVLILDEPTAVLTPQEIPQLFAELRRLRAGGKTILFISHHLEEVLELSDRITVLRKGRQVATLETSATNQAELSRLMIGRELARPPRPAAAPPGQPVLEVEGLSYRDGAGRLRLQDLSLQVRAGEIVGVAGVEGNGQFELVNVLMGLNPPESGRLLVQGHDLTRAEILERRRRIAFVSQDRGRLGAAVRATITENALMTHHRLNPRFTRWRGWRLEARAALQFARRIETQFGVSMASPEQPFQSLSGGNQQKVILGRELLLETPFLLLDQPTRGLDVGSMEYVHELILTLRAEQRAILLISADLEELFRLSDRIVVLHRGRLVADLPAVSASLEQVGALMLEGKEHPDGPQAD